MENHRRTLILGNILAEADARQLSNGVAVIRSVEP